jgi:hypothetical protein
MGEKRFPRPLSVAVAASAAAAVSLVFSLAVAHATRPPGYFMKYVEAAQAPSIDPARLLDFSPLYLLLARWILPLGGKGVLLLVQCFFLAGACALIAVAIGILAGPRGALLGGLAAATYRPFLVYAGVLEPEITIVFSLAAAVTFGLLARRRFDLSHVGGGRLGGGVILAIAAGVCLGLAASLRPQYILMLPVWAFWIGSAAPTGGRIKAAAVTLAAGLIVVSGVVVSRWQKSGSFVIMDPGPVFYEGNGPSADGSSAAAPELVKWIEIEANRGADSVHIAYRRLASANLNRDVNPGESNSYWSRLALESILLRPGRAIRLARIKSIRALAPFEFADLICARELDRRLSAVLPWGFGLLLIGLPWVLFLSRSDLGDLAGPLAVALLALGVQIVFSASARQRLPLALGLLVVEPIAGARLWHGGSGGRRRLLAGTVAGLFLSVLIAWASGAAAVVGDLRMLWILGPRARILDTGVARLLDGRALVPGVSVAATRLARGGDLYRAGRWREAAGEFEPVASGSVTRVPSLVARARYWLARCRLATGQREEARRLADSAFGLMPEDLRIAALEAALGQLGNPLDFARTWRPPGVDPLSARVALARELSFSGRRDDAIKIAMPAAAALPEIRGKSSP